MERLNKSEIIFKFISYILIGAFGIMALYPVVYAVSASISGKMAYESGRVILLPIDVNFSVYKLLYEDKGFWISYINTLFYAVYGTLWSMIISITGAYALAKKRLLFRRQLNFFIVFTMWFTAGMIPTYLNYMDMGIKNKWGIVVAFGVQAYNIILLRNTFEGIPKEIEEAAKVDGVNEFQLLHRIYIPMSKAGIATVALFYATSRWNGYFWVRILVKDPMELPVQVYMRILVENYQKMYEDMPANLPYAADSYIYAILVCSIIPVLLIYPHIQKYFAKGVNIGGVKE
ncbi:MAG: binding-protein-dependent transport system inner rane component [Lachnospiraceae bacterium]|nr:binding-protein-dependent transport system inner rane component [Anaerocolumna sp.]MDF2610299.1 binding-protein-dependent transport system inner rane component [Lachnospiraceae bacterium]